MASFNLTQDQILFTKVLEINSNPSTVPYGPSIYEDAEEQQASKKLINAVDIDWNGALIGTISDPNEINSSGDLLRNLKNALSKKAVPDSNPSHTGHESEYFLNENGEWGTLPADAKGIEGLYYTTNGRGTSLAPDDIVTGVNVELSKVAFSGNYSDLVGKPSSADQNLRIKFETYAGNDITSAPDGLAWSIKEGDNISFSADNQTNPRTVTVSANLVQSNWNLTTTTDPSYILHKPAISEGVSLAIRNGVNNYDLLNDGTFTFSSTANSNAQFDVTHAPGYTDYTVGIVIDKASTGNTGAIKVSNVNDSQVTVYDGSDESNRYYGVNIDSTGLAYVNVPWNSGQYVLPQATASALGGIIASNKLSSSVTLTSANGSTAGRYYGVQVDNTGKAFVNIPWTSYNTFGSGIDGLVPAPTGNTPTNAKTFLASNGTWVTVEATSLTSNDVTNLKNVSQNNKVTTGSFVNSHLELIQITGLGTQALDGYIATQYDSKNSIIRINRNWTNGETYSTKTLSQYITVETLSAIKEDNVIKKATFKVTGNVAIDSVNSADRLVVKSWVSAGSNTFNYLDNTILMNVTYSAGSPSSITYTDITKLNKSDIHFTYNTSGSLLMGIEVENSLLTVTQDPPVPEAVDPTTTTESPTEDPNGTTENPTDEPNVSNEP